MDSKQERTEQLSELLDQAIELGLLDDGEALGRLLNDKIETLGRRLDSLKTVSARLTGAAGVSTGLASEAASDDDGTGKRYRWRSAITRVVETNGLLSSAQLKAKIREELGLPASLSRTFISSRLAGVLLNMVQKGQIGRHKDAAGKLHYGPVRMFDKEADGTFTRIK